MEVSRERQNFKCYSSSCVWGMRRTFGRKKRDSYRYIARFYCDVILTDLVIRRKFTFITKIVGAQLVEALCYKPVGSGFDSRWCHWNFSLT